MLEILSYTYYELVVVDDRFDSSYGQEHKMTLLGVWTLSIVKYSKKKKNTTFRKLALLPSLDEGRETSTLLGLLANGG
jgi:hypothetical protein